MYMWLLFCSIRVWLVLARWWPIKRKMVGTCKSTQLLSTQVWCKYSVHCNKMLTTMSFPSEKPLLVIVNTRNSYFCNVIVWKEKANLDQARENLLQQATVISLWFFCLLACLELWCYWSHHNKYIPEIF